MLLVVVVVVVVVYLRGALLPLAIGLAGHNPLDGVGHTLPVTGCRALCVHIPSRVQRLVVMCTR